MIWCAVLLALLLGHPLPADASDYVTTQGHLSDDNFYRLVACTAAPDGPCKDPVVAWRPSDARDLTIAITEVSDVFPVAMRAAASIALDHAISQVNSTGSALNLRRLPNGSDAHITLRLWGQREGERLHGTGLAPLEGAKLGAAFVHVWWNADHQITRSLILLAADISPRDIRSVLLEEIVQSTGLLTDIDNEWYDTRSIFSENSNLVIALRGQDVMALRRHYPPAR